MITRIKIAGFKNLADVDIRFGTFNCIAGVTGKSNLFDAIEFLSASAQFPLMEAALKIRNGRSTSDVQYLFSLSDRYLANRMIFEVDMIIPSTGIDDLGREIELNNNALKYFLTIEYEQSEANLLGGLKIIQEKLVVLDTYNPDTSREIPLPKHLTSNCTGLSLASSTNNNFAISVKRELISWQIFRLQSSFIREPSEFLASKRIDSNGANLAAVLYEIAQLSSDPQKVYATIANRLAQFDPNVDRVWVERDDCRKLLTIMQKNIDGSIVTARSLSNGVLKILTLAALAMDSKPGLICLEEVENSIHPEKIPNLIQLLQDIVVDFDFPIGSDNPLRQIIVNTHSPSLVQQVPYDSLLIVKEAFGQARFGYLSDTWRENEDMKDSNNPSKAIAKGKLLIYLNPVG